MKRKTLLVAVALVFLTRPPLAVPREQGGTPAATRAPVVTEADREEITPETPVREGSHGAWVAAGTIEDLFTGAGGAARRTPRPAQPTPGPGAAASPATPAGQAPAGPVQQPTPTTQQAPQPAAAAAGAAPPAAGDPAPAQPDEDAPCWHLQTADGARYGPATRAQLDQWFNQGRVGTTCLLWRPGWDQWRPAPAVYPQLAQQPAAPGPSGGTPTPQKPAAPGPSGGTVAPQKPAAPGPSGGTPTPQKPAVPGAPASPAPQDPYTVRMSAAATATGLGGPRPSAPESLAGQTRLELGALRSGGPL